MERIISAALFGIISTVTLTGNALVLIMFMKRRDWFNKTHPCLLLALAVQDMITAAIMLVSPGFVLPGDVYNLQFLSPESRDWYCTLIWSWYILFALSIVSIYTCLMLAVDRCLAVWKALTYKWLCTSKALILTMVILPWLAGFSFEIGTTMNVECSRSDEGSYACKLVLLKRSGETMTTALLLFIGKGLLPALLMAVCYRKLMITLKRSVSKVSASNMGSGHFNREKFKSTLALKKITQMICAASVFSVIFWLPDQIYYCLYEMNLIEINDSIHNGLHIFAFMNTCLNPILYNLSNRQYRHEFKAILRCLFNRNERVHPGCAPTNGAGYQERNATPTTP